MQNGNQDDTQNIPWGWIALGAVVVIGAVALIARSTGRSSARRADWRGQALNAYATGAGLVDAISVELSPGAAAAGGPGVSGWAEVERRADQLSTELHSVETGTSDPPTLQSVTDLESALTILRSSIRAYEQAGPQAARETLTDRVREFENSLRAFRARLG